MPKAASKTTTILEFDTEAIAARELQVQQENDQEILARLDARMEDVTDMTKAVKGGQVRALIVSGPPGVGKSHGVETVLEKGDLLQKVAGKKPKFEVVKGAMTALGLYCKLYEFSERNCVVVFDDCDDVLFDELSLNILKAALDSSQRRFISWNSDSRLLKAEDIPNRFEFKGGAIFITNIKFEHVRSRRLRGHLDALESRCHYLDLDMDTTREKLLWIDHVVKTKGMLNDRDMDEAAQAEVLKFVKDNQESLRELSLRMVLKIADLRAAFPTSWQLKAKNTCMRRA
jgi:hypothetical protein